MADRTPLERAEQDVLDRGERVRASIAAAGQLQADDGTLWRWRGISDVCRFAPSHPCTSCFEQIDQQRDLEA